MLKKTITGSHMLAAATYCTRLRMIQSLIRNDDSTQRIENDLDSLLNNLVCASVSGTDLDFTD